MLTSFVKISAKTHHWWGKRRVVQPMQRPFWLFGSFRPSRSSHALLQTGAHSLPHCPAPSPPPPNTHTHTQACLPTCMPAWTNQTFRGQLIHNHLHNEAFVTPCAIPPKEYEATAQKHIHRKINARCVSTFQPGTLELNNTKRAMSESTRNNYLFIYIVLPTLVHTLH